MVKFRVSAVDSREKKYVKNLQGFFFKGMYNNIYNK